MKRTLLTLIAACLAVPICAQDPDAKKTARAVYLEGLRLETEKKDYPKAIDKYKKAVEKAGAESAKDVAAAALFYMARCHEQEPENITEAQAQYQKIVSDCGDQEPFASQAKEKLLQKGVDVYLKQFKAKVNDWRDSGGNKSSELEKFKEDAWNKIKPLDKDAVPGLIAGLGHEDEVVRGFAAERLADLVDDDGISKLIDKTNDPSFLVRSGAAMAIQRIFTRFNDGKALDDEAETIKRDLAIPTMEPSKLRDEMLQKAMSRRDALLKQANEIRHNIPAKLDTEKVRASIRAILVDEKAISTARLQAAQAIASIGEVPADLAEALIKGTESKDRNVRLGCTRAVAAVKIPGSLSEADFKKWLFTMQSLTERLAKMVTNQPERNEDADWANDTAVRQAAAEALGKIGFVNTIPALIQGLRDNSDVVRRAANAALIELAGRDVGKYESDPHIEDPGYKPKPPQPMTEAKKHEMQLAQRNEAIAKWDKWWNEDKGVDVVVVRFYHFQSQWKEYAVPELFDPEFFLEQIKSRSWTLPSEAAQAEDDRAHRVLKEFTARKDFYVWDAVALGSGVADRFEKFIGGELTLKKQDPKAQDDPTKEVDVPVVSVGVRCFVAEVYAKIGGSPSKLAELVTSGSTTAKKAGAARSLGLLDALKIGAAERSALEDKGLTAADAEVREAGASALGRAGGASSVRALTNAAMGDADVRVRVAALRSLALLKQQDEESVKSIGMLVGDEPERGDSRPSKKALDYPIIRAYAAKALGAIAHPAALRDLIRACRDLVRSVRESANTAIHDLHEKQKDVVKTAFDILNSEKEKSDDRIGAALALGQMNDPIYGRPLIYRVVDENPPRVLKDRDPAVRAAVCRALAQLKVKSKPVVSGLIRVMKEDSEEVAQEAYNALRATVGPVEAGKNTVRVNDKTGKSGPDEREFKAWYTEEIRREFYNKWDDWFDKNKKDLKDET